MQQPESARRAKPHMSSAVVPSPMRRVARIRVAVLGAGRGVEADGHLHCAAGKLHNTDELVAGKAQVVAGFARAVLPVAFAATRGLRHRGLGADRADIVATYQ